VGGSTKTRPDPTELVLPKSVDVAIIGGGFSGLCTALTLARAGRSVAIFEAGVLGCGASTLNGGIVGPSIHKLGVAGLKKKFGEERSNAILKESISFVDFIEEFLRVENIDADFSRVGRFRGALKPDHFDAMARELEILQQAIGVKGEMNDKTNLQQDTGSSLFHGGVIYHQDGGLHPAKYHAGLVRKVRAAAVNIYS
jgi:glycine/D-amino acid oxidase-like deaminating enzyme